MRLCALAREPACVRDRGRGPQCRSLLECRMFARVDEITSARAAFTPSSTVLTAAAAAGSPAASGEVRRSSAAAARPHAASRCAYAGTRRAASPPHRRSRNRSAARSRATPSGSRPSRSSRAAAPSRSRFSTAAWSVASSPAPRFGSESGGRGRQARRSDTPSQTGGKRRAPVGAGRPIGTDGSGDVSGEDGGEVLGYPGVHTPSIRPSVMLVAVTPDGDCTPFSSVNADRGEVAELASGAAVDICRCQSEGLVGSPSSRPV
jgi:hypothetical protein